MGPTCCPRPGDGTAEAKKARDFSLVSTSLTESLPVFQNRMGFVWLIYPARRQHYPDSHTGPRSERGGCTATRAGLIKFLPTNEGMSYPVSQPGELGHCFPVLARIHTTFIALACLPPITVPGAAEVVCSRLRGEWEGGIDGLWGFLALDK